MDRTEAQVIVDRVTCKIGQYAAVTHADALAMIGQEAFDRMIGNAVRKLGPAAGFVYPWNVVDYLECPELGKKPESPGVTQGSKRDKILATKDEARPADSL